MGYKWFKHLANASQSDPLLSLAEDRMGNIGYAMVHKMRELMAAQTPFECGLPRCEVTKKKLSRTLGCRGSKLNEFIAILQSSGDFKIEEVGDLFRFECPKFQELLDSRSGSSSQRKPKADPYRDISDSPELPISNEKVPDSAKPLDASENFQLTAKLILSKKGTDILDELPSLVKNYVGKFGPMPEVKDELLRKIKRRFSSSEKSVTLGDDITIRIEQAYRVAEIDYGKRIKKPLIDSAEKADALRRRNAPERNDPRCKDVMDLFQYGDKNMIDESDLKYTIEQMSTYWGEDIVRKKKIFAFYSQPKQVSIEEDPDDDPRPDQIRRVENKTEATDRYDA